MEDVVLVAVLVALFLGGYYIMRKIDKFLDDYR